MEPRLSSRGTRFGRVHCDGRPGTPKVVQVSLTRAGTRTKPPFSIHGRSLVQLLFKGLDGSLSLEIERGIEAARSSLFRHE